MQKLILIGGGGHCRSCIDVIETSKAFTIVGILDVAEKIGVEVCGYSVVGTDSDVLRFVGEGAAFLITVGQIGPGDRRAEFFAQVKAAGGKLATVISPRAHVSQRAKIGEGTIVMHDALVNACSSVGANCIINTKALVEHDAVVEDHCHVSTGAILNGGVHVGEKAFVGTGAVVVEYRDIPARTFVKAASLWTKAKAGEKDV